MKVRVRFQILALVINVAALAGVLSAMALGALQDRVWPIALFLILSSAAAIYVEACDHLTRRRAKMQSGMTVTRGVRFTKPGWISAIDWLSMVGPAATLGAVAAAVGFASVGVGILLTVTLIQSGVEFTSSGMSPRSITFEQDGLRMCVRGASFLVRWDAITRVDREGREGHRLTCLRILDVGNVIRSVDPDTPRTRRRVWFTVADAEQPTGKLILTPWTAGLDGPLLARAISAEVARQGEQVN